MGVADRAREAESAAARAEASRAERAAREAAADAEARAQEEARKARLRAAAAPPPSCTITELDDDAAAAADGAAAAAATAAADDDGAAALEAREEEEARGKQKPNAGNGGEAEWGVWTQTLGDAELRVSVPPGTTSKAVSVDIKKTSISVGLKGQPPLLAGARIAALQPAARATRASFSALIASFVLSRC